MQELLLDESNVLFVSLVSAWELAIKSSLGKLLLPCPIGELFPQAARDLLAQQLQIDLNAVARVAELPPHHRDPFDRLIIARAFLHECTVFWDWAGPPTCVAVRHLGAHHVPNATLVVPAQLDGLSRAACQVARLF